MASKSEPPHLNVSKNKEAAEKRRPSMQFIDLSQTLVFTKEELEKEIAKIPEQKLRADDDTILMRSSNVRRTPSLINPGDLMDTGSPRSRGRKRPIYSAPRSLGSHSGGGSLDRNTTRKRSSVLSIASSTTDLIDSIKKSNSSNDVHRHSPDVRSFFELIQATSKLSISDQSKEEEEYPYPDPIPIEMRFLNMKDLVTTNIDWKMLTMVRPKSKLDEEYFSRVVELKRLEHQTKLEEGYQTTHHKEMLKYYRHPRALFKYRSRDIDDIDFDTIIPDIDYESYAREEVDESQNNNDGVENANELVAKLLGDDFSDNFIKSEDKEMIERRKSSVKKMSSTRGSPKLPLKAGGGKSHVSEVRKRTRTDSPLPEPKTKLNPRKEIVLNAKPTSKSSKVGGSSSTVKRSVEPARATRRKRDKPSEKEEEKGEKDQEKNDRVEEQEEEVMKGKNETENRFAANVWIDATKEKEAPKIVVTGTLPGE